MYCYIINIDISARFLSLVTSAVELKQSVKLSQLVVSYFIGNLTKDHQTTNLRNEVMP